MSLTSNQIVTAYRTALENDGWSLTDYLLALEYDPENTTLKEKTFSMNIRYEENFEQSGNNWEIPLIIDAVFVFQLPAVVSNERANEYIDIMTTEAEVVMDILRNVNVQNPRTFQLTANLPADNVQDWLFVNVVIRVPYCHNSMS